MVTLIQKSHGGGSKELSGLFLKISLKVILIDGEQSKPRRLPWQEGINSPEEQIWVISPIMALLEIDPRPPPWR